MFCGAKYLGQICSSQRRGTYFLSWMHIHVPEGRQDSRIWTPPDGYSSVNSFFAALSHGLPNRQWEHLWKTNTQTRVLAFRWLSLRGSILTLYNLCYSKMIAVNACPLCLLAEESINHLLLNCKLENVIWNSVVSSFGSIGFSIDQFLTFLTLGHCHYLLSKEEYCGAFPS